MKVRDKFGLISEALTEESIPDHPNIDMIVEKPYLFYYVSKDNEEQIQASGIPDQDGKGIVVFFERIPNIPAYQEFLSLHSPIKISVAKLLRISDRVKVVAIDFPRFEDREVPLRKEDLEDLAKKGSSFYEYYVKVQDLERVPKAKVYIENGVIPSLTFKNISGEE